MFQFLYVELHLAKRMERGYGHATQRTKSDPSQNWTHRVHARTTKKTLQIAMTPRRNCRRPTFPATPWLHHRCQPPGVLTDLSGNVARGRRVSRRAVWREQTHPRPDTTKKQSCSSHSLCCWQRRSGGGCPCTAVRGNA